MRLKRRQIIAVGVTPFEQGEVFCEWPLHVTLVPWFSDARQTRLHDGLDDVAGRIRKFHITLGDRALFGAVQDVPVRLVENSSDLETLHLQALNAAYNAGGSIDPTYVGYKYRPHLIELATEVIPDDFSISQFALIDALSTGERHVTEVFELNGK